MKEKKMRSLSEDGQREAKGKDSDYRSRPFLVVTYLFLFLFLGMIAYFVYFQVYKSEQFINSPYNSLQDLFAERVIRGEIRSADGEVLAATNVDAEGNETRTYPYGSMFAHAVGFASNGKSGLENQENFELLRSHEFFLKQIASDISGEKSQGDAVVTTLDAQIQQRAYEALGDYEGAVIILEPKTGRIIAMVSKPDFDPNTIRQNWDSINSGDSTVLYNRATQGQYAPGSVFKILTLLEYYRENKKDYKQYHFACDSTFSLDGQTIHCAGNQAHGSEDLRSSFANSCNASFANIALTLDVAEYTELCESLLFNKNLPIAFASNKSSFVLTKSDNKSMIMETAIGQGKTLVSPLHMAMIASAIDNQGILMRPYLVDHTENTAGTVVHANTSSAYGKLMTKKEAKFLSSYLESVVTDGTGAKLAGQSYAAYGKTGTAQVSDTSNQTNAWFVGFAKKEGYEDIAIAVIVEGQGSGSSYAVPVAKRVFDLYFNR